MHRTSHFRLSFLFAFAPLFLAAPATAQRGAAATDNLPTLSNEQTFDKVWSTVKNRLYDTKMNGANWDDIKAKYRKRAMEATDKEAFSEVVNEMLSELKVSHADFMTDDDFGFTMFPSVLSSKTEGNEVEHIGVQGVRNARGYEVRAVLNDGPAESAGVLPGDVIISADDKPFTTVGSFRGKSGKSVALKVERAGATLNLTVKPVKENVLGAFLRATTDSARVYQVNGKTIGYIHLWTMGTDDFKTAIDNAVLGKLYNTDGLILDIRDGFGGRPFGFSDVFFRPSVRWEQNMRGQRSDRKSAYSKPMVIITNDGSRSAKEYFAYEFKKTKRATLVGGTTAGAFLGATGFPISKNALLEIPIVGLTLDGKKLEGKGVAPDVVVSSTRKNAYGDMSLKKAEEILVDKIKSTPKDPDEREIVYTDAQGY